MPIIRAFVRYLILQLKIHMGIKFVKMVSFNFAICMAVVGCLFLSSCEGFVNSVRSLNFSGKKLKYCQQSTNCVHNCNFAFSGGWINSGKRTALRFFSVQNNDDSHVAADKGDSSKSDPENPKDAKRRHHEKENERTKRLRAENEILTKFYWNKIPITKHPR